MSNEAMKDRWKADASGWIENERLMDTLFEPVTAAILTAADLGPGRRVLDVGCGGGTLLAAGVDAGAEMVGVDISPGMVEAAAERVPAATVVTADAQSEDLLALAPGAAFDRVISRFGVMFFADPVLAFANLRAAAAPGARLAFACWRTAAENPMFSLGTTVLQQRWDEVLGDRPIPDVNAPGPTAFADYTRLRMILREAGWSHIAVRPFDYVHDHSEGGTSDGVESRLKVVLGTSQGQRAREVLLPVLGEDGWADLVEEVRAELRRYAGSGAVRYPGACWLVTAANE